MAQDPQAIVTGFLTDTLCGAKGATERHVECAKRTVASGKAKYALYVEDPGETGNERNGRLYILEPQESAEAWLGQRVKITGTLSTTPVKRASEKLDAATDNVVRHSRVGTATDSSTPVAGLLKVSTIEPASPPHG